MQVKDEDEHKSRKNFKCIMFILTNHSWASKIFNKVNIPLLLKVSEGKLMGLLNSAT